MKITPAYPLQKLHVLTLLTHTCLLHRLTATVPTITNSPKIFNYKFKTNATRVTRTVKSQSHTRRESSNRITETKMEENKEAIEAQSKFRSEFLQVLSSRRTPQGTLQVTTIKFLLNSIISNLIRYVYWFCNDSLFLWFSSVNRWNRKTSGESMVSELFSSVNRWG
jgi:hypothetical protein